MTRHHAHASPLLTTPTYGRDLVCPGIAKRQYLP
jgi:hypothetical protein